MPRCIGSEQKMEAHLTTSMLTVSGYRIWSVYSSLHCLYHTSCLREPTRPRAGWVKGSRLVFMVWSMFLRHLVSMGALTQLRCGSWISLTWGGGYIKTQWLEKRTREMFVFLDHLDFFFFPQLWSQGNLQLKFVSLTVRTVCPFEAQTGWD